MTEGPNEKGQCWPQCAFFKCGNRSLKVQGKYVHCLWIDDACIGPSCSYALCVRGKMLVGNRCGLTVRRITVETKRPDSLELDKKVISKLSKRIKNVDDII